MNWNALTTTIEDRLSKTQHAAHIWSYLLQLYMNIGALFFRTPKEIRLGNSIFNRTVKELFYQSNMKYRIISYQKDNDIIDRGGFIETDGQDSLLFSSLNYGGGQTTNIYAARCNDKWSRRPKYYEDGFKSDKTKSTISRDMLLGLMFGAFLRRDFRILYDLFFYGRADNWVMGEGAFTRVVFGSLEPLLAQVLLSPVFNKQRGALTKKNLRILKWSARKPVIMPKDPKGYKYHLATLHMMLRVLAKQSFTLKEAKWIISNMGDSVEQVYFLSFAGNVANSLDPRIFKESHFNILQFTLIVLDANTTKLSTEKRSKWLWEGSSQEKDNTSYGEFLWFAGVVDEISRLPFIETPVRLESQSSDNPWLQGMKTWNRSNIHTADPLIQATFKGFIDEGKSGGSTDLTKE